MISRHHPKWDAVLDAWAAGEGGMALARRLGVSRTTVGVVVTVARKLGDTRAVRRNKAGAGMEVGRRHRWSAWHYAARADRAKGDGWAAIARRYGVTRSAAAHAVRHGAGSETGAVVPPEWMIGVAA